MTDTESLLATLHPETPASMSLATDDDQATDRNVRATSVAARPRYDFFTPLRVDVCVSSRLTSAPFPLICIGSIGDGNWP